MKNDRLFYEDEDPELFELEERVRNLEAQLQYLCGVIKELAGGREKMKQPRDYETLRTTLSAALAEIPNPGVENPQLTTRFWGAWAKAARILYESNLQPPNVQKVESK